MVYAKQAQSGVRIIITILSLCHSNKSKTNSCFGTEEGVNEGLHKPRALPDVGQGQLGELVGNVGVLVVGRNVGSGVGVRLGAIQHRRVRCQGRWEGG